MVEIWKKVRNFEGYYEISNHGRLRSLDRIVISKTRKKMFFKGKIIKPTICTNNYLEYQLHKNGNKKIFMAHRLVAQAFISNPDNKPEVNHLDENVQNNCVDNLEWVTSKENANYGMRNFKCRECNRKFFKKVNQYDLDGNLLNKFETIESAAKHVNGDASFISRVCKGKGRTAYKYIWKFD